MLTLIRNVLVDLLVCLKLWRKLLWRLTTRPRAFGKLKQTKENTMSQVFTYSLGLLTPPADVAKQRLVVTVDGVPSPELVLDASATSVEFDAGPAGASVTLSLDYLDAAGNDSENLEMSFVVEDKIAPAVPAGFGELVQTAEKTVE